MNKKKKLILLISIIGVSITFIGISFAYYIASFNVLNKENSTSTITAGSLVETIFEIPDKSDNTNIYPGYKSSKEYIVKGKGSSNSLSIEVSLIVKPDLGDFSKYVYWSLYKSDEEITCNNTLESSDTGSFNKSECNIPSSARLVLSGNEYTTHINVTINYETNDKYYLVTEYLDSNEDQSYLMDKEFNIDVSLEELEDSIQNKIIGKLDTTGKCPTVNGDGTVNVIGIESESSLLCMAPDNYGISYYFRGDVQNNYVNFAGFYWRIVRINGDGSIRMIYDGTSLRKNGETIIDDNAKAVHFNKSYDDNAYVGYKYGTPGSSTYDDTHANINDSIIKTYVDSWYETNLKNTIFEQYLYDNSFCNDRMITSGTGTGKITTWYVGEQKKSLKCSQKNDIFTVNDDFRGNGTLKYPTGLLNVSEFFLGGGYRANNTKFYLYSGKSEWTMTPFYYMGSNAATLYLNENGAIDANYVNDSNYARPVINLKPDSLKSGDGTIDNPYTVE